MRTAKDQPGHAGAWQGLQALRAVACLLVVAFHALDGASPGAWRNGSAGVDLFFVISGFVMFTSSRRLAITPHGWRGFLARRLGRIVPLYWLLSAAKLAIALAAPTLTPATRPTAWNVAASFLFIPARDATGLVRPVLPVGWTLNYEMLFYAMFALALALRRNPLGVLLAGLAPLAVLGFWRAPDWPAVTVLANGLVLEMCAGVALAQAVSAGWRPSPGLGLVLATSGLAALLVLPSLQNWRCLAWGLPAMSIVAGTLGLEPVLRRRLPALLRHLGDASYAIYLSHGFLLPVLAACIARTRLAPFWAAWVLVPTSLFACSALGLAIHAAIDRPIQDLLAARRRGRAAMPA